MKKSLFSLFNLFSKTKKQKIKIKNKTKTNRLMKKLTKSQKKYLMKGG